VFQQGAAWLIICGVAQQVVVWLSRMEHGSGWYDVAWKGAASLRSVRRGSVGSGVAHRLRCDSAGCSVAQEGVAWLKRVQRGSAGCGVAQ
jgi:hypothetical protein